MTIPTASGSATANDDWKTRAERGDRAATVLAREDVSGAAVALIEGDSLTVIATDLARFLDALMNGRLIGQRMPGERRTPVAVPYRHPIFTVPSYGLGLKIDPSSRLGTVSGHAGGEPGYSTAAFHFPEAGERNVICVALLNSDRGDLRMKIAWTMAEVVAEASA
ncbi:MAG TPA: serine hydrolase [Thermomicrobiales bacterium]|nr:serine hydrolase [Thermomicrobiales bacterium]